MKLYFSTKRAMEDLSVPYCHAVESYPSRLKILIEDGKVQIKWDDNNWKVIDEDDLRQINISMEEE